MVSITIQDIKRNGAKAITDKEPTYLLVNSRVKSVMIPPDQYEMFVEALEDLEDLQLASESLAEEGEIPFEEVKKKFKL